MPVYIWTAQDGVFSEAHKKALAKIVTDTHCDATGAPRNFVRVIFKTYPEGSCFSGDMPAPTVFLLCHIRAGRPMETKHSIMKTLNDAALTVAGIPSNALAIIVQDIPQGHGMEFGAVLPDADPEQDRRWLQAIGQ